MELTKLRDAMLKLFECEKVEQLSEKTMRVVLSNDFEKMDEFVELIGNDLSIDYIQKVYQYYLADRKEKKQDYTPKSLAKLMAILAMSKDKKIIDMCAGSGALTIQAWNLDNDIVVECLEFDETVIPFLLFNLQVRNIEGIVKHMDVLENEIFNIYKITRTDKFGKVEKI
ncbi:N-6 DNA methylase [Lactococcus phage D4044]|nr:N-6 DNA methylase [Lactococcus phage D4044]